MGNREKERIIKPGLGILGILLSFTIIMSSVSVAKSTGASADPTITAKNCKTWFSDDLRTAQEEVANFLSAQGLVSFDAAYGAETGGQSAEGAPPDAAAATKGPVTYNPSGIGVTPVPNAEGGGSAPNPDSGESAPSPDSGESAPEAETGAEDTETFPYITGGSQAVDTASGAAIEIENDTDADGMNNADATETPGGMIYADGTENSSSTETPGGMIYADGTENSCATETPGGMICDDGTENTDTTDIQASDFTADSLLNLQNAYCMTIGAEGETERILACGQLVRAVNNLRLVAEAGGADESPALAAIELYTIDASKTADKEGDYMNDPDCYTRTAVVSGTLISKIAGGAFGCAPELDKREAGGEIGMDEAIGAFSAAFGEDFARGIRNINRSLTADSLTLDMNAGRNIYRIYAGNDPAKVITWLACTYPDMPTFKYTVEPGGEAEPLGGIGARTSDGNYVTIPVTYEGSYDAGKPGEYVLRMVLPDGYIYDGPPPYGLVVVQDPSSEEAR